MRFVALIAALALLYPLGSAQADISNKDLNQQIDQTNFLLRAGKDHCSGTLIDVENRYILTAQHCVTEQLRNVPREVIGDDGEISHVIIRVSHPGAAVQVAYA